MYNIDNFNTSFNRTLRSYAVKTKSNSFSYRKLHTTYSIYGLEVVITSYYSDDNKTLFSNFTFAINSQYDGIHGASNRSISRFQQFENNRRYIGTDSFVNRFSDKQLEQFHDVALIASQHIALQTIESYLHEFFEEVTAETELREFNSQFNSLSEFARNQFIKNFVSSDSQLLTTGGNN
jgi:hypothetical protein